MLRLVCPFRLRRSRGRGRGAALLGLPIAIMARQAIADPTIVATLPVPADPFDVQVNSRSNTIFAGHASGLSVIDGRSNTLLQTLNLVAAVEDVAINETTNTICASQPNGSITDVIDG